MSQVFDSVSADRVDIDTFMTNKVPLPVATKIKFMNHVNEEHQDELAMFVEAFANTKVGDELMVQIAEVYRDGLLLQTCAQPLASLSIDDLTNHHAKHEAVNRYFIEFDNLIDETVTIKSQYIHLLQVASKKLGKLAIKQQERYFTVVDGYYASPNMFRLIVTAPADTPLNQAGYAYLFEVNADTSNTHQPVRPQEKLQRYYTLRKAWQDADSQTVYGWIDTYIHGDTPGGNWARASQTGAQIKSVRDYPEKVAHLTDGQCLLICDETSIPTVANFLEEWHNPIAPIVIAVTNDAADLDYLNNLELSEQLTNTSNFKQENITHIVNTTDLDLTDTILSTIDTCLNDNAISIDKVWGALEASDAKTLRRQLKSKFSLPRQDMVMKVYWRSF
ncbi:siderophore-interacting protein [Psychrobacter sp. B38]|uniref:siderophore-interacting protein n=1 Tax=Psychrobacter sp. B38 TaxID=3143538 RepID=UPI00320F7838